MSVFISLLVGVIFGLGLLLSGMANPEIGLRTIYWKRPKLWILKSLFLSNRSFPKR